MRKPGARAKGPDAFRTIGEAADEIGVAPHVLRFWEGKFPALRPLKRGGSRRYYRPRDIELLQQIKHLLHDRGYTIKGAVKALRDGYAQEAASEVAAATPVATAGVPTGIGSDNGEQMQLRQALRALAAECAGVAAGNSPPLLPD